MHFFTSPTEKKKGGAQNKLAKNKFINKNEKLLFSSKHLYFPKENHPTTASN